MRVLVTGSLGFIGTHLTQALRQAGHEVWGCDLQHAADEHAWAFEGDEHWPWYARCDIREYRQLERLIDLCGPFDFVYHTAEEFGRHSGCDAYETMYSTNIIGTAHLLSLQKDHGFKLIHFSTSEVYGNYPAHLQEDVMDLHEVKQLNSYALSKWLNEGDIRIAMTRDHTESVIVRLFNVYGPGEHYSPYRSALCRFIYCALHGFPLTVYRGHRRSWLYIDDLVRTLASLPECFKSGEVYNLGNPEDLSIEVLAEMVCAFIGAEHSLIQYAPREPHTTVAKRVDTRKAMSDLGHQITVNLEEGIARTAAWMKEYYHL
jgi:dTDP-glucose 4,6-dehydratase